MRFAKSVRSGRIRVLHTAASSISLILYDAACRALAEATRVDEAKSIADKATALAAYARQAKNVELEIQSAEIRARAKRRMGEISAAMETAQGVAKGLNIVTTVLLSWKRLKPHGFPRWKRADVRS